MRILKKMIPVHHLVVIRIAAEDAEVDLEFIEMLLSCSPGRLATGDTIFEAKGVPTRSYTCEQHILMAEMTIVN